MNTSGSDPYSPVHLQDRTLVTCQVKVKRPDATEVENTSPELHLD